MISCLCVVSVYLYWMSFKAPKGYYCIVSFFSWYIYILLCCYLFCAGSANIRSTQVHHSGGLCGLLQLQYSYNTVQEFIIKWVMYLCCVYITIVADFTSCKYTDVHDAGRGSFIQLDTFAQVGDFRLFGCVSNGIKATQRVGSWRGVRWISCRVVTPRNTVIG